MTETVESLLPYRIVLASGYYSVMLCHNQEHAKQRASKLAEKKQSTVVLVEPLE